MTVKEALLKIDSLRLGEKLSYQALAKKHSCSYLTLMRQHKGQAALHKEKAEHQRLLHLRNKAELIEYIRGLIERHLMPLRQIIINFATPLCK
jgi:hypothetical protein